MSLLSHDYMRRTPYVELIDDKYTGALRYPCDKVFGDESTTDAISKEVLPLVHTAMKGINVTVFAYGGTGSGKTHTMIGNKKDHGVIRKMVQKLFERLRTNDTQYQKRKQQDASERCKKDPLNAPFNFISANDPAKNQPKMKKDRNSFTVKFSFMEIYNNKVYDVLVPNPGQDLPVREDQVLTTALR